MSDFPGALDMRTAHFWQGSEGQTRKWIICHGTAGFQTAQEVGAYFQTNNPPTSVHYVIGRDGVIVQCVSEADSAWGNGVLSAGHDSWWNPAINPNLQTFSIEHVKPSLDNSDQLTPAQEASSFALIAHLCAAHGIPARAADATGGITGHYSIDPVNRAFCPGPYPWQALWSYLQPGGHTMAGVPANWSDDGATLTAPNGKHVVLGFRDFILANDWNAAAQPTGLEYGVAGGTRQDFTLSLEYTQASNAVTEQAGPDFAQQIADLSAQLAQLNAQLAGAGVSGAVESINAVRELNKAFKALGL